MSFLKKRGAFRLAVGMSFACILAGAVGCSQTGQRVEANSSDGASIVAARPPMPAILNVYDQELNLTQLENLLWQQIKTGLKTDTVAAQLTYTDAIAQGESVYYKQCVHCHGDLLDGDGLIGLGQDPRATDFANGPLLDEASEAYLFWRITQGGPGLPKDWSPWRSAMPAYESVISESDTWNVIAFLYNRLRKLPGGARELADELVDANDEALLTTKETSDPVEMFRTRCAVCHGETGEGDGPAAEFLYPKPRNFTLGLFKYNNSPFKELRPTDENLYKVIAGGLPRTAMPAWGSVLSQEEINDLIVVVKGFDWVGTWAPKDAPDSDFDDEGLYIGTQVRITEEISVDGALPVSETSLEAGHDAFMKNCTPCHGNEGRGSPSAEKKLRDEWGARIWPRDLTKPWTWRVTNVDGDAEETIQNIFTRLSVGIPGTPMPAHEGGVSLDDRWSIAHYVYTLRDTTPQLSRDPVIRASYNSDSLPDSVTDPEWASAEVTSLVLIPNLYAGPRLYTPLNDSISVRVLYNDSDIAFLLEMDDRTFSRPGDPDAERIRDTALELSPDAFAIQFPHADAFSLGTEVDMPLFQHGDDTHPVTLWRWQTESVSPAIPAHVSTLDSTGMKNPMADRNSVSNLEASGEWVNGRWRVLFKRSRTPSDPADISFDDDVTIPIAFSQWDGSNGESGNRHLLSQWYWLSIGTSDLSFLKRGLHDEI